MKRDTQYLINTQYWVDVLSQRVATQLRLGPCLARRHIWLELAELRRELGESTKRRRDALIEECNGERRAHLHRLVQRLDSRISFLQGETRALLRTQQILLRGKAT